jgi:hypothetical protein
MWDRSSFAFPSPPLQVLDCSTKQPSNLYLRDDPLAREGSVGQAGWRKRKYRRSAPSEARDRALAALRDNPDGSTSELAKLAKCSRSTVLLAREELAKEARKAARKAARKPRETTATLPAKAPIAGSKTDRRERAQQFLREQLARGAKQASIVDDAAEKAHLDPRVLEQARADLGVVISRANTGGVQAVHWSLPA